MMYAIHRIPLVSTLLLRVKSCTTQLVTRTAKLNHRHMQTFLWKKSRGACNYGGLSMSYSKQTGVRKTLTAKEKSPLDADGDIHKIRNIGIMAHIDAGKTTTTERMLFYAGLTRHLGDVDDGDTVTDYMEQERERGITITAAAITFYWKNHRINLIDTPGHVDFTLEVERCLRVLDGAIAVIDSSAGVEAQTLTVWRQADRYNVPRLLYLNKMDKPGASLHDSLQSITDKLATLPLLLHIPLGVGRDFTGIVDVVEMKRLTWTRNDDDDGKTFLVESLGGDTNSGLFDEATKARSELVEQLAVLDDTFGEAYLLVGSSLDVTSKDIMAALRRVTLAGKAVPVLCGSSLKNTAVQPLLDAIVAFLPDPADRPSDVTEYYRGDLCMLAFKVIHDQRLGALTFVRLYSGCLVSGQTLYNVSRDCSEKPGKLFQMNADEHLEVPRVSAGNIIAISGLKQSITGDTLVGSAHSARLAAKAVQKSNTYQSATDSSESDEDTLVLAGLSIPSAVVFCSIEPPSPGYQVRLDEALMRLTREDPSLCVRTDPDTGQTILGGMGELHLEIIKDRILKEYGVDADLGQMQIAYRETITTSASDTATIEKMIGDTKHFVFVSLSVSPADTDREEDKKKNKQRFTVVPTDPEFSERLLKRHHLKAIDNGIITALSRGPIIGSSVINVGLSLHNFKCASSTSVPIITACVAQCILRALGKAAPVLLEPFVTLEICTEEERLGGVLSDLTQRRAQILDITARHTTKVITAHAPLAELHNYATKLRTMTSGRASFSMEVSKYEKMSEEHCKTVVYNAIGVIR